MGYLRGVRLEKRISARRSFTSTVPADVSAASHAWLSDKPGWCVDRGETLAAMTTCDLWLALAKGDVTPQTKVWREGMPYWDQVANVPEFALALPEASLWDQGSKPLATRSKRPSERPPLPEIAGAEPTSSDESKMDDWLKPANAASTMEVATMAPLSDGATPEPVIVEQRETVAPPSRSRRRRFPKIDKASVLSVAIGAGFAVIALTIATLAPTGQERPTSSLSGGPLVVTNAGKSRSFASPSGVDFSAAMERASAEEGVAKEGGVAKEEQGVAKESAKKEAAHEAPLAASASALAASASAAPTKERRDSVVHGRHSVRKDRGQQRARVGTPAR